MFSPEECVLCLTSSTDLVQPPFSFSWPFASNDLIETFYRGSPGNVAAQLFRSSRDKNSSELPLPYKALGTFEQSEFQECIFHRRGRVIRTLLWHVLAVFPLDETARSLAQVKPLQLNPRYSETRVRTCVLNTVIVGYTPRATGEWEMEVRGTSSEQDVLILWAMGWPSHVRHLSRMTSSSSAPPSLMVKFLLFIIMPCKPNVSYAYHLYPADGKHEGPPAPFNYARLMEGTACGVVIQTEVLWKDGR